MEEPGGNPALCSARTLLPRVLSSGGTGTHCARQAARPRSLGLFEAKTKEHQEHRASPLLPSPLEAQRLFAWVCTNPNFPQLLIANFMLLRNKANIWAHLLPSHRPGTLQEMSSAPCPAALLPARASFPLVMIKGLPIFFFGLLGPLKAGG